ncbi:hypothetical protein MC885_018171 [Smutsia gigantea]|nr:hypothetical protein MC885_018171 [Smutsia gigantea]
MPGAPPRCGGLRRPADPSSRSAELREGARGITKLACAHLAIIEARPFSRQPGAWPGSPWRCLRAQPHFRTHCCSCQPF